MKKYNVEIGKKLILDSLVYRVKAKNEKEAIALVKKLGFCSGERLASFYKGKFEPRIINEVKE